ncbi:hypothetical protein GOP47_0020529 [Adiantum capillus-veneris]|uniref:Uncharacterized protein n=1 Tax=Adiantum capillus-veneris TaxID=13818 RepID=A0A9D4U9A1_ADICA|nr:hypothetical protein GOP47_0020529 [Adiantum capillus-veneris]
MKTWQASAEKAAMQSNYARTTSCTGTLLGNKTCGHMGECHMYEEGLLKQQWQRCFWDGRHLCRRQSRRAGHSLNGLHIWEKLPNQIDVG